MQNFGDSHAKNAHIMNMLVTHIIQYKPNIAKQISNHVKSDKNIQDENEI